MHIPDGFVSLPVALTTGGLSALVLAGAIARSRHTSAPQQAPLLGLTTAFVFAAQMVNFPVAGGTSGHLLGGTLAAVLTGSWAGGVLCLAAVLIVQALLFADGGVLALGANIFNMAAIGVTTGWLLTRPLQRLLGGSPRRLPLVAGVAAGVSVVAAAIACAVELGLSGTAPLGSALAAMAGIHVLIGVGEGLITGGVVAYVLKVRPDLLPGQQPALNRWQGPVIGVLIVAGGLSLLASSWPDGLEKVAEDLGFDRLAQAGGWSTPLADYGIEGWGQVGTTLAGIIGSIVAFGAAFGVAWLAKPRRA